MKMDDFDNQFGIAIGDTLYATDDQIRNLAFSIIDLLESGTIGMYRHNTTGKIQILLNGDFIDLNPKILKCMEEECGFVIFN